MFSTKIIFNERDGSIGIYVFLPRHVHPLPSLRMQGPLTQKKQIQLEDQLTPKQMLKFYQ